MKILIALTLLSIAPALHAQEAANPVVSSAREIYDRQSKFIVAAAELMPEDKYGYHPTADQWSYGKIIAHVAQSDFGICAMLSGTPSTSVPKVTETSSKAELVAAVKASFDYCDKTMAALQDAQLGDTITFFRGAKKPRARALIEITGDLEDHYSQMAGYLRMNNLLPPSAAPKK
jgi:uncharacterized damage-inducible protein DinB